MESDISLLWYSSGLSIFSIKFWILTLSNTAFLGLYMREGGGGGRKVVAACNFGNYEEPQETLLNKESQVNQIYVFWLAYYVIMTS